MAKTIYCWRCRTDIPMLDEEEWQRQSVSLQTLIERVQKYRSQFNWSITKAKEHACQDALDLYFELTGFKETNVNALWHHRLRLFGPPCQSCGKPLRTPRAKLCAACGAPVAPQLDQ